MIPRYSRPEMAAIWDPQKTLAASVASSLFLLTPLTPGMSDTRGLEQRLRPASKLANL